jgi:hypothetical protein
MKLEANADGFTIDAKDLADLLGFPPEEVRRLMREGGIRSRVERGEGKDAGRYRLTLMHPKRQIRLIVSGNGEVLAQGRVTVAERPRSG